MKKLLALLALCLLAGIGLFAWTLTPAVLDTPQTRPDVVAAQPQPPEAMRLSILKAGHMQAQEIFSYRGGSFAPLLSGMAAVLVQHPDGDILIDTGFGSEVDAHYATTPMIMQMLASYTRGTPAAEQLRANGYDFNRLRGIYLTHAHWDHVSGLPDFPGVPAYLPLTEKAFVDSGNESAGLLRSFVQQGQAQLSPYSLDGGAYEIFARSKDLYGDGSVVIVELGGHTPGSVGVFVNLPSGKRYLFAGDIVWAREGYQIPAERPWLARRLVDHNEAGVRAAIVKLHALSEIHPELAIVPAHDRRMHETLAQYPASER